MNIIDYKIAAIIFNMMDYFLTIVALKLGGSEGNPIGRFMFRRRIAFFVKFLFCFHIWYNCTYDSARFITFIFFIICMNNLLAVLGLAYKLQAYFKTMNIDVKNIIKKKKNDDDKI